MTTLEKLQWLIAASSDCVVFEPILLTGDETEWNTQITIRQSRNKFCFCGKTASEAIENAYDHLNKP